LLTQVPWVGGGGGGELPVTVSDVVPEDPRKLEPDAGKYVPTTVSVPVGALVAVQLPDPPTSGATHVGVPPAANDTEPVGVPEDELTVAE